MLASIARNVHFRQEVSETDMHAKCKPSQNQGFIIAVMDYAKISGKRIFEARKLERNWTRRELSERTDGKISASQINNYEHGTRMLGPSEAVILGQALEKRPSYLLGVDDVQTVLTAEEEVLIRNWRELPGGARAEFFQKIESMAMIYRAPVKAEAMGKAWSAPKTKKQTPRRATKP